MDRVLHEIANSVRGEDKRFIIGISEVYVMLPKEEQI